MLSLIGTTFPYNTFTYDATGIIAYNSTTHALNLDATPLFFKPSLSISRPVSGTRDFLIQINVDNSGNLIGGVAGNDLIITGTVAGYGSGTLLTGEISQFEWQDSPTTTDLYAFRFTPTGGALASYFSNQDICITTTSELSNFAGNFNVNFSGGAKGNVGPISPLLSSVAGNAYLDTNNNGVFDTGLGETGIPNTTVRLTGANVDGAAVNIATQTDAAGAYLFSSLRPGTYTITETQPAGYLDGIDTIGTPGGTAGNDVFSNVVLAAGVNGLNNNFGELPLLPGIHLVKLTNGTHDPYVPAGDPVTWTYEVSNTGNAALGNVSVGDDDPSVSPTYFSGDANGNDLLDLSETWIYTTASATATPGQYDNTGTATGTATDATGTVHVSVSTIDVDHYFGVNMQLQLVKLTNDTHNPNLEAGSLVTWTYEVTNPGNVALANLTVTDDQGVTPLYDSGDADSNDLLDPGEMWIYTASGTAVVGTYVNIGTATAIDATPMALPISVTGSDGYFGVAPGVQIVKMTNGTDNANLNLPAGSEVNWTYNVSNTGNVALGGVIVTDDTGLTPTGPGGSDTVIYPVYQSGDANENGLLDPGETWIYAASGMALAGQYNNTAMAIGNDASGAVTTPVTAADGDSYFGVAPGIQIVKLTNGADNANANVAAGGAVSWTYMVTNTGNKALSNLTVTDSDSAVHPLYQSGDDGNDVFDAGETWIYTAAGVAIAGQYSNTGTAGGIDATGTVNTPVSASEGDSYFGVQPGIQIVKLTNGADNANANLAAGSAVTWTYNVTNIGNVALNGVAVSDSTPGVTPFYTDGDNGNRLLDVGETWLYTAIGTAIVGQYNNTGTASGLDVTGAVNTLVSASEGDSYFGVAPGIQIVKLTNGADNTNAKMVPGSAVTWTYNVTNTGNVALNEVAVTDSDSAVTPVYAGGDDGNHQLDVGETWVYTAAGTVIAGQYNNTGTASALDATSTITAPVSASEADSYFGVAPGIKIVKLTNGTDNNSAPGAQVIQGCTVTWTFDVTNNGNVALSDVTVTDSDSAVTPVYQSGDTNLDGKLDLNEMWVYAAAGTAVAGQYSNTGTASGKDATATISGSVSSSDVDYYFGEPLPVSLSGYVYVDNNNDGIQQADELGIAGVNVTLRGTDDLGNAVNLTDTTDANGAYSFTNLRPGVYTLTETQPDVYLDGKDAIGTQGGHMTNDALIDIVMASGVNGTGNNFGELLPSGLSGFVFNDANNNGEIDFGELAIVNVTVRLSGVDDLGNAVSLTAVTDANGSYSFTNLRPGTYTLTETQPDGYLDGMDSIGTQGGIVGNDQFSNIILNAGSHGINNNFAEMLPVGSLLHSGQTATIGFWHNKNGQALIKSLNGGQNSTALGNWLAANFNNMYGANAGAANLAGKTNTQIASYFLQLFGVKGQKLDAQALAVALAVYVSNSNLAGNVAANYGFIVNSTGTGAATYNIGSAGAAFNVANNTTLSIMAILQKTNEQARKGVLWDLNANGSISSAEQVLRNLANDLLTDINETGDIS